MKLYFVWKYYEEKKIKKSVRKELEEKNGLDESSDARRSKSTIFSTFFGKSLDEKRLPEKALEV